MACSASLHSLLVTLSALLLLLLASACALELIPGNKANAVAPADAGLAESARPLSRQKRNPAALLFIGQIGSRYGVQIGREAIRYFSTRKQMLEFLKRPDTLRKINNLPTHEGNIVRGIPSKNIAKQIGRKLSQGRNEPIHHPQPKKGGPHYHPADKNGKKLHPHIEYPRAKPIPKRTGPKFSPNSSGRSLGGSSGRSSRGSSGRSSGGSSGRSSGGSSGRSSGGSSSGKIKKISST